MARGTRTSRRRWRNEDGTITIEFVIVLPLLLAVLALTFGSFHAFLQFSRASKSMHTVADIISRYDEIDTTNVVQLRDLYQSFISAPAGAVLRVSRIDFTVPEPGDPIPADSYSIPEGYYTIAWSLSGPEGTEATCPTDADGNCLTAESFKYPIDASDLANYSVPTIGDGAHIILVDVFAPYRSPLAGGAFRVLPAFDVLNWTMSQFIWPRSEDGLTVAP
ncbi:MAG: hypothetical protein AAGA32_09865 [Pseudomonadota bacterium]